MNDEDTVTKPSMTVLCVDDELDIIHAMKRLLRKQNYHLLFASSGEKALEIMQHNDVHLIISDMKMPTMSGAELLEKVTTSYPNSYRILLTGYADMESTVSAINKGKIHRYLQKPWDKDELISSIEEGLEKVRLKNENKHMQKLLKKQNISLKEAQQSQRQFFAQMSHEIRTPLNGVVSALSLLDNYQMDSKQANILRLARSSSENLMQVINYVLNISKLELSPHQEQKVFSWPDLIQSTTDIVTAKAQEKSLLVVLDLAPDLPQTCYGNPDRLRQTLLNLTFNAIKFTDSGTITIRALPVHWAKDHCILRLEVIDTGIGIPEKDLPHIFDPFWSSQPNGIAELNEGTGLGLDIVRRNVCSMGGEVRVKSTLGQGTKFWFELPAKMPVENGAGYGSNATQQETNTIKLTGKVMLVDDNQTNLLLGSMILESMGLEVTSVDGGGAAIVKAKQQQFDLVLMDISMPEIDGLEATRQIRAFASRDLLPIIALTAHIDDEEKTACFDIGMNDYLTKPVIRKQLNKTLATWLSKDRVKESHSKEAAEEMQYESDIMDTELVTQSVIDKLILQIGHDNLRIVISKVRTEATQRWDELVTAEKQGDKDAIKRHLHSLASIFRSVGLMPVGDALGAIETKLRAEEKVPQGWLNALEKLKTDSIIALAELIEEPPTPSSKVQIDTK